jgi:hypothetical protein
MNTNICKLLIFLNGLCSENRKWEKENGSIWICIFHACCEQGERGDLKHEHVILRGTEDENPGMGNYLKMEAIRKSEVILSI